MIRSFPLRDRVVLTLVLLSALALSGCGVTIPSLRHPGHLYTQQLRATYHDPYAEPELGPPIEGGRPEQYEIPRAIPVQAQWYN
ncbi:MAG: membrane or secreted protein [Planctomycetota bacterium]